MYRDDYGRVWNGPHPFTQNAVTSDAPRRMGVYQILYQISGGAEQVAYIGIATGDTICGRLSKHVTGGGTNMTVAIERLSNLQPECLATLIAESERGGLRFVRRLADEWTSGANRFDRPGEALFLARSGDDVIGVCGLNIDPYAAQPNV